MMPTFEDFARTLDNPPTEEQRAVITSNEHATLVIAGAGSGKTATMAHRIAWKLIEGSVRPEQVLGLTFTRKAAGELAQRVNRHIRHAVFSGLYHDGSSERDVPEDHSNAPTSSARSLRSAGVSVDDQLDLAFTAEEVVTLRDESMNLDASTAHSAMARPTISTYNSFASEIATTYGMLVGADPQARLMTEADRWQLMYGIVSEWGKDGSDISIGEHTPEFTTRYALSMAAAMIDNGVTIDDVRSFIYGEVAALNTILDKKFAWSKLGVESDDPVRKVGPKLVGPGGCASLESKNTLLHVVEKYFAAKKERSLIEFADQVSTAALILESVPEIADRLSEQYPMVLLDEYQDTSVGQARLIRAAFGKSRSVTAVGDPNQAIYGWRGASASALTDFAREFNVRQSGQLSLSTAFRNGSTILAAANKLTTPLTYRNLHVRELTSLPNKAPGEAIHVHTRFADEGYSMMAQHLAQAFARHRADYDQNSDSVERQPYKAATAAVVVRSRKYIPQITRALEQKGLEYEILGGEAIIQKPEILAVRALLTVVTDPQRNPDFVYLLNYFGLGPADLVAFSDACSALAKKYDREFASQSGLDATELKREVNFIDHLADVVELGERGALPSKAENPLRLSSDALKRLGVLSRVIDEVRQALGEPLPNVVDRAINALNMRGAARAKVSGQGQLLEALSRFVAMAADYAAMREGVSLRDFVGWLREVDERDRGGEGDAEGVDVEIEDIEPRAGVVQILTVHAAKGLEWDFVAVPEMVEGEFDEISGKTENWVLNRHVLPYPLRADYEHIPQFSVSESIDNSLDYDLQKLRVAQCYKDFLDNVKKHEGNEQRRLAYVAVTRPRSLLIVMSYDVKDEKSIPRVRETCLKISGKSPWRKIGSFAWDMAPVMTSGHGYVEPMTTPEAFVEWADDYLNAAARDDGEGGSNSDASNSASGTKGDGTQGLARGETSTWPRDVNRQLDHDRVASVSADRIEHWRNVLAWHIASGEGGPRRALTRDYLTVTDIVKMSSDVAEFDLDQRRPIPTEPSMASRRGVRVHELIAHHFGSAGMVNLDAVASGDEMPLQPGADLSSAESLLMDRFRESRFVDVPHIAIEQALDISLAGYPVRCVLDAVLDTSGRPGMKPVTIVDWKTGRRPRDIASRELQLAIYRLAWSRSHGVPLDDIDACFYYLGEHDETQRELHAGHLSEDQVVEVLEDYLRELATRS